MSRSIIALVLLALAPPFAAGAAAPDEGALARNQFLTGRYRDAQAAYARLASQDPARSAIGVARCLGATGELDAAIRALEAPAARSHPAVRAERALLEFSRGRHEAARAQVDSALAHDPNQPAARWVLAELHRVAGRLEEANDGYRWFIGFYNREERIADPEALRWIGLAAAQYARWNRNSGQFHFLVNTLYPEALARDSTYWPAHLESALLFVEKYNLPDAVKDLDAALAINLEAAELHAARALVAFQRSDFDGVRTAVARALELNPRLLAAHHLDADLRMVTQGPREALGALERARALNPVDEETLGRLAAAYGGIDGVREDPSGTRMGAVIEEATGRNPRCGAFFAALATGLDLLRKYPHSARYFEEARRRMPQLIGVPGQLGLVAMRLGDEAGAREILAEAFDADPFNLRVKNTLAVLELLSGYRTLETDHFIVRFDPERDSLLARQAARYLETEVHPEVVKVLAHSPADKATVEIFSSARGETGHGWFSARMVGFPFIGTVGACAGKVVAIASPNDGSQSFNWARVLKHEFVHFVNLLQTDFNVPRWFTEGLAVRYEGGGTPRMWDFVLARRAAADSLFDLTTLNLGFVRPSSGEDWALAYCQAELYVRYVAETHGEAALGRLLAAYADNLDTPAALERSLGVGLEAFERGYRSYIERMAGSRPASSDPSSTSARELAALRDSANRALGAKDYAEAERLLRRGEERFPVDADWTAGLVHLYRDSGQRERLAELLARRMERDSDDLEARLELARMALERSEWAALERWAREALQIDVTDSEARALRGRALAETGRAREAVEEYEIAVGLAPRNVEWRFALARACLATGDRNRARELLARVLEAEPDHAEALELFQTLERP